MTTCRYLYCDSCGRTLALPATREAAASWRRLEKWTRDGDRVSRDVCGQCDTTALMKSLERL